jgi:coproporphyrinogen III oxidase-like Fe-S oxidoreductase
LRLISDRVASSTEDCPSAIAEPLIFGAPTAAYLHIPFCRRRCYYCDFAVSIVGDRPPLARSEGGQSSFGSIAEYVEMLCQEIAITPALGRPLETVFFGGGTPSLLSVEQLEQILSCLIASVLPPVPKSQWKWTQARLI